MPLRITNLRLPVEVPEQSLPGILAERLKLPVDVLGACRIVRKSLDARSREHLVFVYTLVLESPEEARILAQPHSIDIEAHHSEYFADPPLGSQPLEQRPVVVGSGPAGILAAYYLAMRGYRPIVLERGSPVKERVPAIRDFDRGGPHDPENNYLFGEGGAGTFSDGKLTCRMSGPDVDWVLNHFVECGGKPSILYEHRPHLGSNRLPMLVRNFRRKIEAWGGEYRFQCRMEGLDLRDGRIQGLHTSSGYLPASVVILGPGHSARDTYEMLHATGVPLEAKAFQLGLRIEQPQAQINQHKYGRSEYLPILGAADYTLVARGQRDLYTFCMCAGGVIIPSVSEGERFCSNGMSNSRHDTPFANSGLVVTLDPFEETGSTHPLAGVHIQRQYEALAYEVGRRQYLCPSQPARDFISGKPAAGKATWQSSYQRGIIAANLQDVLPPVITQAIRQGLPIMDKKWHGEFLKNAVLVGPEMRGSSPVRIPRDSDTRQVSGIAGLYPIGEGAGYAGGIISAAVDGLRSAKSIVMQYAVP